MPVASWIRRLNGVGLRLAEAALFGMMVIISYAVVARYVFRAPSVHAVEVSAYLLVVLVWAVAGWVHVENRHVSLEAFTMNRSAPVRLVMRLISELATLCFCLTLLYAGVLASFTAFDKNYRSASLLEFPLWIVLALIPIGALMLALVSLDRLRRLRGADSADSQGN